MSRTDVPFKNIPTYRTAGFIGRESLLQHIDSSVRAQTTPIATIILVGMGGSGKTQLALRYCENPSLDRSYIFWIDALSEQSVRRAYDMIADDLAASDPMVTRSQQSDVNIRSTLQFISRLNLPWVVVFDNYDDPAAFRNLKSFMPSTSPSTPGTIIITSRHTDVARLGGVRIEVGPMIEEEGIDLFLARAAIPATTQHRSLAFPIVRRLGCLALALDQAGNYVQKRKITLEEFSSHFEAQKEEILNHKPLLWNYTRRQEGNENELELSVFTTWELSFNCLQRSCPSYQLDFTKLLAFFHCSGVSEKWFRVHYDHCCLTKASDNTRDLDHAAGQISRSEQSNGSISTCFTGFADQTGKWDYLSFRQFLSSIYDLFLIQRFSVTEGNHCSIAIHPLVADWMKLRLNVCERTRIAIEAGRVCRSAIAFLDRFDFSLKDKQELLSHVDECLMNDDLIRKHHEGEDLISWNSIINSFADFYYIQGRYKQAADLYECLLQQTPPIDSTRRIEVEHSLATVYHSQGQHYESEYLYKKVIEQREAQLGRNHWETLRTIECLANIYRSGARLSEARDLYLEVLEGRETHFGPDHPQTLQVVANLAINFRTEARYEDAEILFERALSGYEKSLGADHSTTILVINDLANNFEAQGQHTRAEALYRRALEWRKINIGDNHPDTAWTMADLASNLRSQGRYDEARDLYRRAISCDESLLGMDHPETLWAIDGLANVALQQHRYDESQALFERALHGREKCLGSEHHNTLRTVNGLGMTEAAQGRYDEAERLFKRTIAGLSKRLGPDHPKTINVVKNLAQNHCSKKEYAIARDLYTRVLEALNTRLGANHPQTVEVARCLEDLRLPEENSATALGVLT